VEIVVDLTTGIVVLADAEETDRFALAVSAPPSAGAGSSAGDLARVLEATGVGRLDASGDAFIEPEAVRFRAAGQVADGWDERFTAMLDAARSRGWLGDDGAIQAHVEWPGGAGA